MTLFKMMMTSGHANETRAIAITLRRSYTEADVITKIFSIEPTIKGAELMRTMNAVWGAGEEDENATKLAEAVCNVAWKARSI